MWPTLISIGPFHVYSYGVSIAMAFLLCSFLLSRDAARHGISKEKIYDFMFWTAIVGGIVGARIFYVALKWDFYATDLLAAIKLWEGGLAWQGGFIGALLVGLTYIRSQKISVWMMLDLVAPYIALGQAIGRLGCFANGCCYGKSVAWGIYFPVHQARLHPTQLYEAGSLLLIFFLLKAFSRRPHQAGMIFVGYLTLAGCERFMVEFYRADQLAFLGPLSLFQWISLMVVIAGGIIIGMRYGR